MFIYICDVCNKRINRNQNHFMLSFGQFLMGRANICESCGGPLEKFISKHKLGVDLEDSVDK